MNTHVTDAKPLTRRLTIWTKTRHVRRSLIIGTLAILTLTGAVTFNPRPQRTIVAFGDSYFSGYGIDPNHSFPVQFEKAMKQRGHKARVINAGVPGETIADGLVRLDKMLATKPDLVILELGTNDWEMGLDPVVSRANLDVMLQRIKAAHVRVLLCGAVAPASVSEDYQASFNPIYPELAAKHRVPLYPAVLAGVSQDAGMIQDDGEHPNEKGVEVMVDRILPVVEKALNQKRR